MHRELAAKTGWVEKPENGLPHRQNFAEKSPFLPETKYSPPLDAEKQCSMIEYTPNESLQ